MMGLVWKDLYVMKSMGRSYIFMFGIFAFMSLLGIYDGVSFVSFLMVMMLIMMPINTFAYDEQAKWDRYAAATPAGRKGVVAGKYLFTALLLAAGLLLCMGLQVGMYAMDLHGDDGLLDMMMASMVAVSVGAILNAVLLPLLFKFGTQKGRIFLMVSVGIGTGGIVVLLGVLSGSVLDVDRLMGTIVGLLPILAVGLMVISYFISQGIYGKKEL